MGGLFSKHGKQDGRARGEVGGTTTGKLHQAEMSGKDQAVLKLKVTRDRLEKAKKRQTQEQVTLKAKVKALLKDGKKENAKLVLRTMKYKEKQLEKLDGELFNLVKMINDVEWAEHQLDIVQGVKAGTDALKALNELMPLEEVERIMDESAEAMAEQEEISRVISQGLDDTDEDEVLAEFQKLEDMEAAELESSLPEIGKNKNKNDENDATKQLEESLPNAPNNPVSADDVVPETTEPERKPVAA